MSAITAFGFDNVRHKQSISSKPNKDRLYLAFYRQRFQWDPSIMFHTALLLTPKKPEASWVQSWRYHVRECLQEQGVLRWEYEGSQVNLRDDDRDGRIVALVLLAKWDPAQVTGADLAALLMNVEVDPKGGDGGARDWIWNAIRYLVEEDVIPPFPARPQTIWQNGDEFAEVMENCKDAKIPTCNIDGRRMKSTVPRG
ncbi:hypothetical protein JAAARDRAFT_41616 [Jaapia argillacea MUCL 33604]|uniref:Uncharacterized protein n=1 Tax=Jaapia argillacea MUCL 33604 TaxID=933084 RepID=A0A067PJ06_9AGAM|nr:hypothetical protein JAAARDRAFT_41616 [Jaapia argillacea MUCL 33604]